MFHRSSLLMTATVLCMGLAWFGIEHFGLAEADKPATDAAQVEHKSPGDIRFNAAAADHSVKPAD